MENQPACSPYIDVSSKDFRVYIKKGAGEDGVNLIHAFCIEDQDQHILYSNPTDPFKLLYLSYPSGVKGNVGLKKANENAHEDLIDKGYEFDFIYRGYVLDDGKSFPSVITKSN